MEVKGFVLVAIAGAFAFAPLHAQSTVADFSYSPVSPGTWTYRAVTGGSEASFVDGTGTTRMVIACGRVTRLVTISRVSAAPAARMSFWTSTLSRDLASRFDQPSGRVVAQVGGLDPLLDAIAFSRGRFAVSMPGYPALVLPAGTEIGHVVEDCRA
jgi:hypothetical protein